MNRPWTAVYTAARSSKKLRKLPDDTCRVFFYQLLLVLDSYGCIEADATGVDSKVWPSLKKPVEEAVRAVRELVRVGLIQPHSDGERFWFWMPDWDEKAGAHLRRRGKAEFESSRSTLVDLETVPEYGTTPGLVRDGAGLVQTTPAERKKERSEKERSERESVPDSQPELPRPADGPDHWKASLAMHPTLATPAILDALKAWDEAERQQSRPPWPRSRVEANMLQWERWEVASPGSVAKAIRDTIKSGAKTPYIHKHDSDALPPANGAAPKPSNEPPDAKDVFDRWSVRQSRLVRDGKLKAVPKYPGTDKAREELEAK